MKACAFCGVEAFGEWKHVIRSEKHHTVYMRVDEFTIGVSSYQDPYGRLNTFHLVHADGRTFEAACGSVSSGTHLAIAALERWESAERRARVRFELIHDVLPASNEPCPF